jgi:hypothetical protein
MSSLVRFTDSDGIGKCVEAGQDDDRIKMA